MLRKPALSREMSPACAKFRAVFEPRIWATRRPLRMSGRCVRSCHWWRRIGAAPAAHPAGPNICYLFAQSDVP